MRTVVFMIDGGGHPMAHLCETIDATGAGWRSVDRRPGIDQYRHCSSRIPANVVVLEPDGLDGGAVAISGTELSRRRRDRPFSHAAWRCAAASSMVRNWLWLTPATNVWYSALSPLLPQRSYQPLAQPNLAFLTAFVLLHLAAAPQRLRQSRPSCGSRWGGGTAAPLFVCDRTWPRVVA
jgi:hypothetical protein